MMKTKTEASAEFAEKILQWLGLEYTPSVKGRLAVAIEDCMTKAETVERARIIEELEGTLKNIRRASPTGDFSPYRVGLERAISIIKATSEELEHA